MFRPRPLLLLAVLLFYSAFGDSENVGKSEITEDFQESNSRKDAEQDPLTTVALDGDSHSTLFSTCLAKSRTIQTRFASIEVVPGSEYIRYVPDSSQLAFPISWNVLTGNYASILDCAQAAHDGSWSMFKHNGSKCEVVDSAYGLDDVPKCEEIDTEAVFILSTTAQADCPMPRFFVGIDEKNITTCGLVSKDLMTYDEAKAFCAGVYPNQELALYVNEHPPLTPQMVFDKLTALGYTTTNLWTGAEELQTGTIDSLRSVVVPILGWYGNFIAADWWDGQVPAEAGAEVPFRAAYLDKAFGFKLRASDKGFKAGVLCITRPIHNADGRKQ